MNTLYYGKQFIDDDDIQAVLKVLKQDFITCGPMIPQLESDLCDVTRANHAVAVSNGTAALHLACLAAGIREGDEVITTPMTFAASANAILYCGGTPVFADIDEETWNIDPKPLIEKITNKTKAIIAVDFTGQVAPLYELKAICKDYELTLIEDAAHSLGSKYFLRSQSSENVWMDVGNIADLTTFSFHPVKTITGGEGGAILTNNKDLFHKLVMLRTHGMTNIASNGYESLLMDHHPVNLQMQTILGYNYRMTDFQAALISSQLKKLLKFAQRRKEIVSEYNKAFASLNGIILQKETEESDSLKHLYILRFDLINFNASRKEICDALGNAGVICNVHYIPVYYHPYYQKLGYKKGICPRAEKLYEEILTIPLYYSLTNDDVEQVIGAVKQVVMQYAK